MSSKAQSTRPTDDAKRKKTTPGFVTFYLVAYNTVSALCWGFVLQQVTTHVLGISGDPACLLPLSTREMFASFFAAPPISWSSISIPYSKAGSVPLPEHLQAFIPKSLWEIVGRATTAYIAVGPETAIIQTVATLEVLHAALGWVRSPITTTAMQVSSRLFLVWGVTELSEVARTTPLFASMVFAWSFTEVIRYAFYAFSLIGFEPYPLLWLRYTTFYILYPIGAGSEAFVNFATLPKTLPFSGDGSWTPVDYVRGALFLIWWPGLYVMYTYMMGQRKKVLGKGRKLGTKPKTL